LFNLKNRNIIEHQLALTVVAVKN